MASYDIGEVFMTETENLQNNSEIKDGNKVGSKGDCSKRISSSYQQEVCSGVMYDDCLNCEELSYDL